MKISDIFYINQGHQITDEELYNSSGDYLVLTGNNEIKGYWDKTIVKSEDLPCISYPTKGNHGVAFIQNELFDANNTAVLIPKVKFRKKVSLEWFKYKLPSMFLKIMTSKEGVSYLNKEIVENIDVNLPSLYEQTLEAEYFRRLDYLKQELNKKNDKLDSLMLKSIIISMNESEEILISNIFNYISRNDSLSEEGVYNNFTQYGGNGTITVLSGSTQNMVYGKVPASTDKIHSLRERQCIHVVTRGKAGKLTYLNKGTYATNTNAYLIYIEKDNWIKIGVSNEQEEEIYLKFMKNYLQPIFYQEISMSDVGVFAISEVMKKLLIPLFKYDEKMKSIVRSYETINRLRRDINESIRRIDSLIGKEVTKSI